jgi:hypothetical protein
MLKLRNLWLAVYDISKEKVKVGFHILAGITAARFIILTAIIFRSIPGIVVDTGLDYGIIV